MPAAEKSTPPHIEIGEPKGHENLHQSQSRCAREIKVNASIKIDPHLDGGKTGSTKGKGDGKGKKTEDEHKRGRGKNSGQKEGEGHSKKSPGPGNSKHRASLLQTGVEGTPGGVDEAREYRGVIEGMGENNRPKGVKKAQGWLAKAEGRTQGVI